jgi:hypothetical protein
VQVFGTKVGVPPQVPPVLVARYQRNLLNGESVLEQSACALMPQVVKVQIGDS